MTARPRRPLLPLWLLVATLLLSSCGNAKDILISGSDRTKYPVANSAWDAFAQFREFMRTENYQAAYKLLSSDSRRRYKWFEFNLTFKETRFGSLLRYMYTEWDILGIQLAPDQNSAWITLQHYIYPEHQRKVQMVREDVAGGQREWKLRWVLCNQIGMPESDERELFPKLWQEPTKKSPTPDPDPVEDKRTAPVDAAK